ncbi:MAG: dienelactone hydrolase family protein [Betaproteobacteria bacterium]|nr:dienelactone hydrolase family protein [Betaproteobacteria bacterium]
MIDFKRPDGSSCRGYLANAGQGRPGMVLIQEWWGLNPQICSIADRLAAAGYNALAPDLFKGRIAQDADEASHMMNGLDFPGATHEDIRGATQHLLTLSPKVGVMGFCMGGALTIASAVHVPELTAAVCFYGIPPKDFADPAHIRIPLQGHFAKHDAWCTPALVQELASAMSAAGNPPEIYEYDAEHAFFNQTRPEVYDAECSKLAWDRTLSFLSHHL